MKHTMLRLAALALLCLSGAAAASAQAPTGYTTVSWALLHDATGAPITNATIRFQPANTQGVPISFRAGGAGGQAVAYPVSATVTSGAGSIILADTSLTSPLNVCYSVTLISNLTGRQIPFPGYSCIQPSGSTWSLDSYIPNLASLVVEQAGTPGTNANLVPDPNFVNGFADWTLPSFDPPGTWTFAGGLAYGSLNSIVVPAAVSGTNSIISSSTFYLTVGQTYVLSGFVDAAAETTMGAGWQLYDPTLTTQYASIIDSAGSVGSSYTTFTFSPSGHAYGAVLPVVLIFDTHDAVFTSLSASAPSVELAVQGLPGATGPAGPATISVGTTTALAAGAAPTVTNSGTSTNVVLNFGIPAGTGSGSGTFSFSVNGAVITTSATTFTVNGATI